MVTEINISTHLYVDRTTQQWVVLDSDGNYWTVPPIGNPWEHRQPFHATEQTELERVPGHYKSMVGLPF